MTNNIVQTDNMIKISVDILIVKEDDYYIAYCPALELSAYGLSIDEAKISFDEEVNIFLEETHKKGTLEKYLLKNGWKLQQSPAINYEPPRTSTAKIFDLIKKSKESEVISHNLMLPV